MPREPDSTFDSDALAELTSTLSGLTKVIERLITPVSTLPTAFTKLGLGADAFRPVPTGIGMGANREPTNAAARMAISGVTSLSQYEPDRADPYRPLLEDLLHTAEEQRDVAIRASKEDRSIKEPAAGTRPMTDLTYRLLEKIYPKEAPYIRGQAEGRPVPADKFSLLTSRPDLTATSGLQPKQMMDLAQLMFVRNYQQGKTQMGGADLDLDRLRDATKDPAQLAAIQKERDTRVQARADLVAKVAGVVSPAMSIFDDDIGMTLGGLDKLQIAGPGGMRKGNLDVARQRVFQVLAEEQSSGRSARSIVEGMLQSQAILQPMLGRRDMVTGESRLANLYPQLSRIENLVTTAAQEQGQGTNPEFIDNARKSIATMSAIALRSTLGQRSIYRTFQGVMGGTEGATSQQVNAILAAGGDPNLASMMLKGMGPGNWGEAKQMTPAMIEAMTALHPEQMATMQDSLVKMQKGEVNYQMKTNLANYRKRAEIGIGDYLGVNVRVSPEEQKATQWAAMRGYLESAKVDAGTMGLAEQMYKTHGVIGTNKYLADILKPEQFTEMNRQREAALADKQSAKLDAYLGDPAKAKAVALAQVTKEFGLTGIPLDKTQQDAINKAADIRVKKAQAARDALQMGAKAAESLFNAAGKEGIAIGGDEGLISSIIGISSAQGGYTDKQFEDEKTLGGIRSKIEAANLPSAEKDKLLATLVTGTGAEKKEAYGKAVTALGRGGAGLILAKPEAMDAMSYFGDPNKAEQHAKGLEKYSQEAADAFRKTVAEQSSTILGFRPTDRQSADKMATLQRGLYSIAATALGAKTQDFVKGGNLDDLQKLMAPIVGTKSQDPEEARKAIEQIKAESKALDPGEKKLQGLFDAMKEPKAGTTEREAATKAYEEEVNKQATALVTGKVLDKDGNPVDIKSLDINEKKKVIDIQKRIADSKLSKGKALTEQELVGFGHELAGIAERRGKAAITAESISPTELVPGSEEYNKAKEAKARRIGASLTMAKEIMAKAGVAEGGGGKGLNIEGVLVLIDEYTAKLSGKVIGSGKGKG